MFLLLTFLIGVIFNLFKLKKELLIQNGIKTYVKASTINAFAKRFVGSVRREALDYYLLISEMQIVRILREYFKYYNSKRPHQGIDQRIPNGYKAQTYGGVVKIPILGGLCHHYVGRVV